PSSGSASPTLRSWRARSGGTDEARRRRGARERPVRDPELDTVAVMARLIDGARLSAEIRSELAAKVEELGRDGIVPGLTVVLVGNDPASEVYVRSKTRACEQLGMRGRTLHLPADVSREEL